MNTGCVSTDSQVLTIFSKTIMTAQTGRSRIWFKNFAKLFTLRASHRGGDELRTSICPSNFALIAAKFWQRAFQTICNSRFFDAENFFSAKFSDQKIKFSSNSTSILRPIRPQCCVQFDLNFTSNSTSILRPDRNQWDNFFLPTVRTKLGGHETPTPDNTILLDDAI